MSNANKVKRESGLSALIQVLVVGAVVVGSLVGWYKYSSRKKEIADKAIAARQASEGDDAPSLFRGKVLFDQIDSTGATQLNDPALVATMADLESQLYFTFGVADAKARAEKFVSLAKDRDLHKAERYAAEAFLMLGEGRAADADKMLTDLINNRGARHAKLLHALAVAKLMEGNPQDAVVAAQEGEKLSQLQRLRVVEGDAYLAMGNYAGAKSAFEKAGNNIHARAAQAIIMAATRSAPPEALNSLVGALDKLADEAHAALNAKPEGDAPAPAADVPVPPRVKGFIEYAKGEVLIATNQAAGALQQAEASLTADPGQPPALSLKGRALAKLGKTAEAKSAFEAAMAATPSSLPTAKAAAKALRRAGAEAEGLAILQSFVAANVDNGFAHAELSLFLAESGKGKDAIKAADDALAKLGSGHDLALFASARALQADKNFDKARTAYGEALRAHGTSDWPDAYFALGRMQVEEKDWDSAAASFEKAITLWDKMGGSYDDIAEAWEQKAKALGNVKGKTKDAKDAQQKADDLRAGKTG
jgi:tetratricopeptide (TPR) repeat protein